VTDLCQEVGFGKPGYLQWIPGNGEKIRRPRGLFLGAELVKSRKLNEGGD